MKTRGFTLVELLAVVVLLGGIIALVFPNVLERIQSEEKEILERKQQLVYTAAYDILYEQKGTYPIRSDRKYCVNMGYMAYNDRMPIDDYKDILKDSSDVYKNYIMITIGDSNNLYKIVTDTISCTDGIIGKVEEE